MRRSHRHANPTLTQRENSLIKNQVIEARDFSLKAHADQQYGDQPYAHHLDAVVTLLDEHGPQAQVIGYLHDVVEDTDFTCEDIETRFGKLVADAVAILTDEPGKNRKERKQKTYEKMSQVTGDLQIALIVKTADRLANVQASLETDRKDKLKMYQKEHPAFKTAVYRPELCDALWEKLDAALLVE
ncbi:HD domain-containing protein [Gimesia chilikensis]|uniref:HD domain-containing protein n=1 Tax=Gimesia chilikensis TaxID=2605989 RepID=UPI0018E08189|nr:HD domain-containing protein [Gimesia chilikensis]